MRNEAEWNELTRRVQAAATKEEARAVTEAMAQRYLVETPQAQVPIEVWRDKALENIGFMTGYMDRAEANRILDLFETEHPWRDREGNELPSRRKRGQSRRARPLVVLSKLILA